MPDFAGDLGGMVIDHFRPLADKNFFYFRVPDVHLVKLGPAIQVLHLPGNQVIHYGNLMAIGNNCARARGEAY